MQNNRNIPGCLTLALLLAVMAAAPVAGQNAQRNYDSDYDYNQRDIYVERVKIDRYLAVDIWPNHDDGEYFIGDRVSLHFRVNRDAFVAIYSIDSKGRVNLLFPSDPGDDNFVYGGVTYSLPGPDDDYDLVVTGPEGVENIQIVASRERFPIPDWYDVSGLYCDWDDRLEYMDYLNSSYFVRYSGQRFAFDRTALYINQWEPQYYRPVYYPHYPSWTVCGNVYIDYPYGATVYVNGVYWGCAPLYIPRIHVGWHTLTIYDRWGYCWESSVHVSHFHTVVLDRQVVNTRPGVASKYKEVHSVGYRSPVSHGYPGFDKTKLTAATIDGPGKSSGKPDQATRLKTTRTDEVVSASASKKYVRGTTEVIKTDRGVQTAGITQPDVSKRARSTSSGWGERQESKLRPAEQWNSNRRDGAGGPSAGKSTRGSDHTYDPASGSKRLQPTRSTDADRYKPQAPSKSEPSGFYQKKSGASSTQRPSVDRKPATQKRESQPAVKPSKPANSGSKLTPGSGNRKVGGSSTSPPKTAPKSNSGGSESKSSGKKSR